MEVSFFLGVSPVLIHLIFGFSINHPANGVPSGYVKIAIENGGSFHSDVSLPEGTPITIPYAPCMVFLPTKLGDS